MKGIFTISFLLISTFGYSQDYNFKPQWKQGNVITITITQVEKEYEDDKLMSDTTTYNDVKIEVLKDNKDSYILEVIMENQALRATKAFYDKLGDELQDYRDLKLIYIVNKETAEAELQNWEDAQEFMNNSFEQISSVVENRAPEVTPYIGMVFMPLKEIFKSRENIEASMEGNIGYILTPFNKDFEIGRTITTAKTGENPFNPMQQISVTTLLTLESVNKEKNTCKINQRVELDLSEFIEMMKGIVQKMFKSFGTNEGITDEKNKGINEFEMDIENFQEITFDYQTTWVAEIVGTVIVTGIDPQKGIKTKKEILTTTEIK